ncbi:RcnB family protein [Acinetobacter haemolyticus]|uniref:RcnB family protein n=1 Tax=Acinetobacter haemolyticus TaxID=29430 RepID=UPI000D68ABBB|nr:RcnB family protein [Acinetobacter haemolyticus]
MKKFFIILILGSIALLGSVASFASPPFDRDEDGRGKHGRNFERSDNDNRMRERRMREERGVERLKQHRWQAGYVMPQHYRGNGYKIDYKENNLPKPGRNQQWYKINNDYILVNSDDNSIVSIRAF